MITRRESDQKKLLLFFNKVLLVFFKNKVYRNHVKVKEN